MTMKKIGPKGASKTLLCRSAPAETEEIKTQKTSPEVQNKGISGPTKRTCVLQNLNKKQKNITYENEKINHSGILHHTVSTK